MTYGRGLRWPLLAAGVLACCALAACDSETAGQARARASAAPSAQSSRALTHTISGPLGGARQAELDVVSGATLVDVTTADLRGDLYRASTPGNAGVAPVATVDHDVIAVSLASTTRPGPAAVRIVLSSRVSWRIRLDGGAGEESVDLTGGRLAGLDFGAGCAHISATLPAPVGTVPVTMSGGASSFDLHLPGGVPARVLFAGGAGSASVDGSTTSGLAGGTVLDALDWSASANRYDIDNTAGVSALTLDRA
jgi:hypothetical protein